MQIMTAACPAQAVRGDSTLATPGKSYGTGRTGLLDHVPLWSGITSSGSRKTVTLGDCYQGRTREGLRQLCMED